MTALHHLTAAELSAAYAGGTLSPVDAAKAVLARIDAWKPKINAMYRLNPEAALASAKASESGRTQRRGGDPNAQAPPSEPVPETELPYRPPTHREYRGVPGQAVVGLRR